MTGVIVVGLDHSDGAKAALQFALEEAQPFPFSVASSMSIAEPPQPPSTRPCKRSPPTRAMWRSSITSSRARLQ